ncbi:MAG: cation diffusion facilitator family transporter [Candidatus Margulisbacteria bacterium]|nr:cation diffusion facilitator family transporter [Candidatus Margulisiibacteriota bacterium]
MSQHSHIHEHEHHHTRSNGSEPRLIFSILLNLIISVVEIIGGVFSGSISLLSDALHNVSDTFSLLASFVGMRLAKRENNESMTFGYKRAEVLIALLNSSILLVTSLYLFKEAFVRLLNPVVIHGRLMMIVALISLVANVLSVVLLKGDAEHSLNIRSAYLHLIMDALSSVAVVFGAILVIMFQVYWIDGVFSMLISAYVLFGGYSILWEAIGILMHNVPKSVDLSRIQADISAIKGVQDIHHVHVWSLTEKDIHLEGHINVGEELTMCDVNELLCAIEKLLREKHGIIHTTIQVEHALCKNTGLIDIK